MSKKENKIIPQVLAAISVLLLLGGLIFPLITVKSGDQSKTITSSNINEDISFIISNPKLDVQLYLIISLIISLLIFASSIIPQLSEYFKYSGYVALASGMFSFLAFDEVNDYVNFLEFALGLLSTFTTVGADKGIGYFAIAGSIISSLVYSLFVSYQQYFVIREPPST